MEFGQYYLGDFSDPNSFLQEGDGDGLITPGEFEVTIRTGTDLGEVAVQLRLVDAAPRPVMDSTAIVSEASIYVRRAPLTLTTPSLEPVHQLQIACPTYCRVRVQAFNRDHAMERQLQHLEPEPGFERHELTVWAEPRARPPFTSDARDDVARGMSI